MADTVFATNNKGFLLLYVFLRLVIYNTSFLE